MGQPVRAFDSSRAARWGVTTYSGRNHVEPIERPNPNPRPPDPARRFGYAPGLDGVRALAVTAVVVYHLGATWLSGGFLGVDMFFVLSGFLITSILLVEFQGRGVIDIKQFYLRRARRLLPALYVMLATLVLYVAVFARSNLHQLRGDVVAALLYCTNWTQIAFGRSYFGQANQSLLQHLWSLAVEEQFYLLWPLILIGCLAMRRKNAALIVTVGLAAVSTILMAVQFRPGEDPARVYYGTDTHIAPMLVGAAMAIVVTMRWQSGHAGGARRAAVLTDVAALVGLAGLAWAATSIDYYSTGLYRGGYVLIAIAAAAVILAAASVGTVTAWVLARPPLVWIGQRSYAIYLWHWPILVLSGPKVDMPVHGPVLIVAQVGVIVLAAHLSYTYVERPIRSRGFVTVLRSSARPVRVAGVLTAASALAVTALLTAPGTSVGIEVDHSKQLHVAIPSSGPTPTPTPSHGSSHHPYTPPPPFPRPVRTSFFGDSQGMTLLINKPTGLAGSITTSDSTVEGCSVIGGTIHSTTGYERDMGSECANWASDWKANAARNNPQIAVVELGAWDVFDITVNGRLLKFGTPAWDRYWEAHLEQGVHILIHSGAQVALMGVPCYRPIAAGGLPLLPERGYDSRTRHVTALLREAAAKQPRRVFMIHPPPQFCHDPSIATDTAYRWDGTHYYKPGAALVFKVITPQLLAIPQPPPSTH